MDLRTQSLSPTVEVALVDAISGSAESLSSVARSGIGKTTLIRCFIEGPGVHRLLWGNCDAVHARPPPPWDMAAQLRCRPRLLSAADDRASVFAPSSRSQRGQATAAVKPLHWVSTTQRRLARVSGAPGERCNPAGFHLSDDEVGPRHPLRLLLGDRQFAVHESDCAAPLTEEAVRAMVGEPSTRANFIVARLATCSLSPRSGITEGIAMPPTVRDAVVRAARLRRPPSNRLPAAAVVGPRIDLAMLADMDPAIPRQRRARAGGVLAEQANLLTFRNETAGRCTGNAVASAARSFASPGARRPHVPAASRDAARLAYHAEGARDCAAIPEPPRGGPQRIVNIDRAAAAPTCWPLRCADRCLPSAPGLEGTI
jgi:hypothetical protein